MADANPSANTPTVPVNPAPSPENKPTPSQPTTEDNSVTLSKEAHAELTRKAAVAETAQKEKAGLENKLNALLRRKVAPLPALEAQAVATVKSQVATAVIADPKYAPLLQKNPTLAKVLSRNPLDLLDNDEFLDEQDATNQVLDYLDSEAAKMTDTVAPAAPPVNTPTLPPKEANPGEELNPTVTPTEKERKDAEERDKHLPAMERVTNKIASRLNIQ